MERFGLAVIGKVGVCANLARSYAEIGEYKSSISTAIEAVESAERSLHNFSRLFAYEHIGWSYLLLDKPDNALPYLKSALDLCETT
ncbi:tetratricopeptide repeat protein, partial [Acinetobacter baumannii]